MNKKKITVIMSNFNGGDNLKVSIKSILNQTYKNFLFKIIDDNSNDNSLYIINNFAKKDKRIQIYKNSKRKGLPKNLNKLIKLCNTKYIARMDSDDISKLNRLQDQLKQIEKENLDILGSNCIFTSEKNSLNKNSKLPTDTKDIYEMLNKSNPFIHSSVIYKKEIFKKIGYYDKTLTNCQDLDLWFRAKSKGLNVKNSPKFLMKHKIKNFKSLKIIYFNLKVLKKNIFKSISFFNALFFFFYNLISLIKYNILQICKK